MPMKRKKIIRGSIHGGKTLLPPCLRHIRWTVPEDRWDWGRNSDGRVHGLARLWGRTDLVHDDPCARNARGSRTI